MALYKKGERKQRPGIYMRIVNSGAGFIDLRYPTGGGEQPVEPELPAANAVLVSPECVLYEKGNAISVENGSDGENTVVFERSTGVSNTVSGETLEIKNPAAE